MSSIHKQSKLYKCSICNQTMKKNRLYCSDFCRTIKREFNGLIALKEIENFIKGGEDNGMEDSNR